MSPEPGIVQRPYGEFGASGERFAASEAVGNDLPTVAIEVSIHRGGEDTPLGCQRKIDRGGDPCAGLPPATALDLGPSIADPGQLSLRYSRDFGSIRSTIALAWEVALRWRSGGRA